MKRPTDCGKTDDAVRRDVRQNREKASNPELARGMKRNGSRSAYVGTDSRRTGWLPEWIRRKELPEPPYLVSETQGQKGTSYLRTTT